jgi:hypothetical protein
MQEAKQKTTNNQCTRTKFQRFVNKALCSAFKKLIIAMPNSQTQLHVTFAGAKVLNTKGNELQNLDPEKKIP